MWGDDRVIFIRVINCRIERITYTVKDEAHKQNMYKIEDMIFYSVVDNSRMEPVRDRFVKCIYTYWSKLETLLAKR